MKSAKRIHLTLGVLLTVMLCLSSWGVGAEEDAFAGLMPDSESALSGKPVIEIREKMFIAQCNDIYLNLDQYMDSVIKYQGLFGDIPGGGDEPYHLVYRNSPGCCGNDGIVGFEVIWDQPYPAQNTWVEAVGTLERYEEWEETYVRLRLASLTEPSERGAEFVTQ